MATFPPAAAAAARPRSRRRLLLPCALLAAAAFLFLSRDAAPPALSRADSPLITWDYAALAALRDTLQRPDALSRLTRTQSAALARLHHHATRWVGLVAAGRVPLVTDKSYALPTGASRNHFISVVPYAHACNALPPSCRDYAGAYAERDRCDNATGLPWMICDGQLNFVARDTRTDRPRLESVTLGVTGLSLSAFLFGDAGFAHAASELLDAWFVSNYTRMYPTLRFAQGVPGVRDGKPSGCIDMSYLGRGFADAVQLLRVTPEAIPFWDAARDAALRDWSDALMQEMLTDTRVNREADMRNNHGLFYDLTVLSLAHISGQRSASVAREGNATTARPLHPGVRDLLRPRCTGWRLCLRGRFADQADRDGAPTHEIGRPNRAHYVWYGLLAHAQLYAAARGMGYVAGGGGVGGGVLQREADWAVARMGELAREANMGWMVYGVQALRLVARLTGDGRYERAGCALLARIERMMRGEHRAVMVWSDPYVGLEIWNLAFPAPGTPDCAVWDRFAALDERTLARRRGDGVVALRLPEHWALMLTLLCGPSVAMWVVVTTLRRWRVRVRRPRRAAGHDKTVVRRVVAA